MPFIDSKVTIALSEEQKEKVKAEFGKAISVMGKTENFLMVGFEENYDLFMGGKKLEKGAFVSVKVFGQVNPQESREMTTQICRILDEQLEIPGQNIYVTYQGITNWGWNGNNF